MSERTLTTSRRATRSGGGTKHRPHRRERILHEAVALFSERGFTDTGIDEIGAAAGISGPGIYRHFESKQQILEEALRSASERVLERTHSIVEHAGSPREAFDQLISGLVGAVVDAPALLAVLYRERHHLDRQARAAMDETYYLYVEEWVKVLVQIHSSLTDEEARVAMHAVMAIAFSSAQFQSGLPLERLAPLVDGLIRRALDFC